MDKNLDRYDSLLTSIATKVVDDHQRPNPVLDGAVARAFETEWDMKLPALLKRIYCEIGDGGLGPREGMLKLCPSEARDQQLHASHFIATHYAMLRRGPWPEEVLPFMHWGCDIYSCVSLRSSAIYTLFGPVDAKFEPGHLCREELSLEAWIRAWLDGENLWDVVAARMTEEEP